jgi:hypothetical protein
MTAYTIVTFPVAGRTTGQSSASPNIADQSQLNATSSVPADQKLTVAAFDSIVPIPYGRVWAPALLANAADWSSYWYFWLIWGRGPIEELGQMYLNGAPYPYLGARFIAPAPRLGTDSQPTDPWLVRGIGDSYAFRTGLPNTFDEHASGLAYITATVFEPALTQPPQFSAIIKGKKVFDPRSPYQVLEDESTWTYSRNAALCLGDFLRNTEYGAGLTVDEDSLIEAANACDDSGRYLDLLIDKRSKLSDWVATLATAANCFVDVRGGAAKLLPDANRSAVATYTHAGGDILSLDGEATELRANLPTVVEIVWTDTSSESDLTNPTWKDATVSVERPGVRTGETPWRKSSVRMPWIQDAAQALREAYLRMNKTWLRTPTFTVQLMDEALLPEVGDSVMLAYPDSGYTAIKVKIANIQQTPAGWAYGVFYDDPGAYVDDRIADPTPPTDNPDPFDVPPVENLTAVELITGPELFASWDAPANYPYTGAYPYTVEQVGASPSQVEGGRTVPPRTDFTTGDLTTEQYYTITVWNRNVLGMLSVPRSVTVYLHAATYVASRYTFRTPTLVNMKRMFDYGTGEYFWVTSMGDAWNPTFPNPMSSYTNALLTYHSPGTSTLTTEEFDTGTTFAGVVWDSTIDAVDISGTGTRYIELRVLSSDAWVRHAGLSYTGNGRRVRLSSEATGTGTQRVNDLGSIAVTANR